MKTGGKTSEDSFENVVIKLAELEYLLDAAFHFCEIGDLPQCETGLLLAEEKLKAVKEELYNGKQGLSN